MFRSVCEGLESLHETGHAHCDIRPENIIFDADTNKLMIIDFSNSRYLFDRPIYENEGCTPFLSPEMVTEDVAFEPDRADVWALGVVILTWVNNG